MRKEKVENTLCKDGKVQGSQKEGRDRTQRWQVRSKKKKRKKRLMSAARARKGEK